MRHATAIFRLPHNNDASALETHQSAVFAHFASLFAEIDQALRTSLPKVKSTFALHDGPVDLSVHAPLTRYLVRLDLASKSQEAFDEEDVEFDMVRVSNCGLCIRTSEGDIRVLKSPADGLPKALSNARVRFVTNNQLSFFFAEEPLPRVKSLNLFVLWRMDSEHIYTGMDIACPKETLDKGDIDCFWIAPWLDLVHSVITKPKAPVAPDLDEIVAVPARKSKALVS